MMDVTPEPVDPKSLPEPESAGAKLLKTKCTECHGLVTPRQHAAQEWPSIVNRMDHRMQMMARGMGMMRSMHITPLTSAEKATLLDYLERNSFRAAATQAAPAPGDAPAQAFFRTCSRCHAPPDPGLHTPAEWDAVVARMAKNMEQQGFGLLPDQERELVLKYLSRAQEK